MSEPLTPAEEAEWRKLAARRRSGLDWTNAEMARMFATLDAVRRDLDYANDRCGADHAAAMARVPVSPEGLDVERLEPILTGILNRLAPIVGGDLLSGGVKHRIGLSSAIATELAAALAERGTE